MTDRPKPGHDRIGTVSEARFASMLDTAVDGIVVIDDKARILAFNKACETLFGYSLAEAIGRNVRIIMPEQFAREHDDYIDNYLRTGERRIIGIGREVLGQHKDGTIIPIELSVGESRTPVGRQFIGILRDIRSRKAVEERLAQLQAQLVHMARVNAMDEMGAAVAHELNQPLTAVMLYLQAILRRAANSEPPSVDERTGEILAKALRETERAGVIIQRIRKFIEKRDPERQPIDLRVLVGEALELTALGSRALNITFERHDTDDMPSVAADPVQIQQIIVNLLRNAVEAVNGGERPWIRISTYACDGHGFVEVVDSGPGIPPDAFDTLFKAFSSGKPDGLGLGLAISRAIAQNHGGDLIAEAGEDGVGAKFILKLPATEETAMHDPDQSAAHARRPD